MAGCALRALRSCAGNVVGLTVYSTSVSTHNVGALPTGVRRLHASAFVGRMTSGASRDGTRTRGCHKPYFFLPRGARGSDCASGRHPRTSAEIRRARRPRRGVSSHANERRADGTSLPSSLSPRSFQVRMARRPGTPSRAATSSPSSCDSTSAPSSLTRRKRTGST